MTLLLRTLAVLLPALALAAGEVPSQEAVAAAGPANLRYLSPLVTRQTPGHGVAITAEIKGERHVSLIVTEGGDGYACDHADWLDARFIGPTGERRLADLPFIFASAGWGQVRRNLRAEGGPLTREGTVYAHGIGTHSPSLIVLAVPEGCERFAASGALDDSGIVQGHGSTVQFAVFAGLPTAAQARLLGITEVPDLERAAGLEAMRTRAKGGADEAEREYVGLVDDLAHRTLTSTFHGGIADAASRARQAVEPAAVLLDSDRDPLDVVLRRTRALWEDLKGKVELAAQGQRLAALEADNQATAPADAAPRLALFRAAVALRREIAFSNPLLSGIDRLLYITRNALPPDEYNGGTHMCDQFFGFHATQRGKSRGDGLFVLEQPFSAKPTVRNLLAGATVTNGRLQGKPLAGGGFLSPALSYDGNTILFAWTEGKAEGKNWRTWSPESTFHIFTVGADGQGLTQLTDGAWNEFDPCFLPSGRVMFISERRGGFGRCHGRPVPNFTLHSMYDDGSDITCLSPHETNEWQPSVDNNGMVVYTRWDYVDRGFNQAHHAWITYPDGRDARALNGNTHDSQRTAPHMEMEVHAIPGSPYYAAIASGHHTETRGSIILIDPRCADDGAMSQVRRFTPDQLFPEAEFYHSKGSGAYASPWPLSDHYLLCVYDHDANAQYGEIDSAARNYALCLVDAFGNKEIIYRDPVISCLAPIPLRARPRPPIIPHGTLVGLPPAADGSHPAPTANPPRVAKMGVMNVYDSRLPFPAGTRITQLRIWEVIPKSTPVANKPRIGYGDQKPAKACLGTVPVEEDGSAFWEQPVGVPVLFHALDAEGVAVQGMRSATYVQPGETLMCTGCHEQRAASSPAKRSGFPKAMSRPPSVITPEMDGSNPFSFPRLVQPVLDARCVACHQKNSGTKKAIDLSKGDYQRQGDLFYASFTNLRPYAFYYNDAVFTAPYTIPGEFGAKASKLWKLLSQGHHDLVLTPEEKRRLGLWLDSNGLFYGHEQDIPAQASGAVVAPCLQ